MSNFKDFIKRYLEKDIVGTDGWNEFTKWKSDSKKAISELKKLVGHVLFVKYSRSNTTIKHWMSEIYSFRSSVKKDLSWGTRDQNTNAVNAVRESMEEIYKDAIVLYNKKMPEDSSLPKINKILPEASPFTLEDLIEFKELEEILIKLPKLEG